MMGFIHDEQRARSKFAEYVPQPGDVIFFREQAVENDKPRTGGPRVDAEALKPSQVADALTIDYVERKAELAFELVLPLR